MRDTTKPLTPDHIKLDMLHNLTRMMMRVHTGEIAGLIVVGVGHTGDSYSTSIASADDAGRQRVLKLAHQHTAPADSEGA